MMAMVGERFKIDLDSDGNSSRAAQPVALNLALVGDIKERVPISDPNPPQPPEMKNSQNGFPVHKNRSRQSKFKQQSKDKGMSDTLLERQNGNNLRNVQPADGSKNAFRSGTRDPTIDQENKHRLAQMSEDDIQEARQELMSGLSPSLIEKLLKKANLEDDQTEMQSAENWELMQENLSLGPPKEPAVQPDKKSHPPRSSTDPIPAHLPNDLQPVSQKPLCLPQTIHFPNTPEIPNLDPSDPNFLSALHSIYFPTLPADPSAMAWMTPLDPNSSEDSAYADNEDALLPSELRFDFHGHLLPPRLSSQIPVTKGLHHHAHAPSSAGYTIPELAHLARSTYPAQCCIAYQTLGRILYRLGSGYFGLDEDVLCEGLWRLMDEGKVIEQLTEVAAREDQGNRSIWVTATEAVWLWRKGGGRRWRGR